MSPPGTFSISSAFATPSKETVGITIISPWPGDTESVTFMGQAGAHRYRGRRTGGVAAANKAYARADR